MDVLLFKNLRFFDLSDKGYLPRLDFFKGIAKCGVVIDTHVPRHPLRTWISSSSTMPVKMARSTTNPLFSNCSSRTWILNSTPVDCRSGSKVRTTTIVEVS